MDSSSSSGSLPRLKKCLNKFSTTSRDFVRVTPQVEVFSLYINGFDVNEDERCGSLYGTIEAVDIDGTIELYDRKRQHPEQLLTNHPICFTGPPRSISASVGFVVNIDLHMRNDKDGEGMDGDYSNDVEISKWQLSWDVGKPEVAYITRGKFLLELSNRVDELSMEDLCKVEKVGYEQALKAVFRGKDGCYATMYYAILQYAVQALLWVDIVHLGHDEDPPPIEYDVHGRLCARYGKFKYDNSNDANIEEYCKATLLDTRELGSVKGVCGKRLELSRSVMVVPAYSSLVIEADLWYKGINSSLSLAKGTVEFLARSEGYSIDYMVGEGDIGIKLVVGWSFQSEIRYQDPPY